MAEKGLALRSKSDPYNGGSQKVKIHREYKRNDSLPVLKAPTASCEEVVLLEQNDPKWLDGLSSVTVTHPKWYSCNYDVLLTYGQNTSLHYGCIRKRVAGCWTDYTLVIDEQIMCAISVRASCCPGCSLSCCSERSIQNPPGKEVALSKIGYQCIQGNELYQAYLSPDEETPNPAKGHPPPLTSLRFRLLPAFVDVVADSGRKLGTVLMRSVKRESPNFVAQLSIASDTSQAEKLICLDFALYLAETSLSSPTHVLITTFSVIFICACIAAIAYIWITALR